MKKAEMSSKMLVTIILLIFGFVLVLIIYSTLNLGEQSDKELCHASVIARGTAPSEFNTKNYIPLKCKTGKICITDKSVGKGDCSLELGEDYVTVRVSSNPEKQEQEIKKIISDEMVDCWSMMGEGKIQVFTNDFNLVKHTQKCSVCTRISFDKSIKNKKQDIQGLVYYQMTNNISDRGISYWDFLTHNLDKRGYNSNFDRMSTEQKAIIFMEVDKSTATVWFASILGAEVGAITGFKSGAVFGSFIAPGIGTAVGGLVGLVGGYLVGEKIDDMEIIVGDIGQADYLAGNALVDYNIESLQDLNCDSIENIP